MYKNPWHFINSEEDFPPLNEDVFVLVEEDTVADHDYPGVIKATLTKSSTTFFLGPKYNWVCSSEEDQIEEGYNNIPQDWTVVAWRKIEK